MRRCGVGPASTVRPDRTTGVGAGARATGPRTAARTASAVRGRPLGKAGRTFVVIESAGTCGVRLWDSVDRAGDGRTGAGGGATVGAVAVGGTTAGGGVGGGVARGGWATDAMSEGGATGRGFTGRGVAVPVRNAGCCRCRAECFGRFVPLFAGCFSPLDGAGSLFVGAWIVVSEEVGDPGLWAGAAGGASKSNALRNFPRSLPMASGRLQVLRPAGAGETRLATFRQPNATTSGYSSNSDRASRSPGPGCRLYDEDQSDDPANGSRVGGGPPAARYGPLEAKPIRVIMTARGTSSFDASTGE